jgi:hypothetical protein
VGPGAGGGHLDRLDERWTGTALSLRNPCEDCR